MVEALLQAADISCQQPPSDSTNSEGSLTSECAQKPPRTLTALTHQVSGKKLIYIDAKTGAICKPSLEKEPVWYRLCQTEKKFAPFLPIIPEVVD